MKIAVLGTGGVGTTLGGKLEELGHEVRIGSREAKDDRILTFADAAAFGESVINATPGGVSLEVLAAAGEENLAGKVLIDVSNPLDFSGGMPPTLSVCNDDSVAEQIQRAHPEARVVKTLNTVNSKVMVDPSLVPGSHTMFVCGDDEEAKDQVSQMLQEFGWPTADILDLGGIENARGPEMLLPLWLRLMGATGTATFNVKVVVADD